MIDKQGRTGCVMVVFFYGETNSEYIGFEIITGDSEESYGI
jgi:hypothetical protein